jgi:hypothetical protein
LLFKKKENERIPCDVGALEEVEGNVRKLLLS